MGRHLKIWYSWPYIKGEWVHQPLLNKEKKKREAMLDKKIKGLCSYGSLSKPSINISSVWIPLIMKQRTMHLDERGCWSSNNGQNVSAKIKEDWKQTHKIHMWCTWKKCVCIHVPQLKFNNVLELKTLTRKAADDTDETRRK